MCSLHIYTKGAWRRSGCCFHACMASPISHRADWPPSTLTLLSSVGSASAWHSAVNKHSRAPAYGGPAICGRSSVQVSFRVTWNVCVGCWVCGAHRPSTYFLLISTVSIVSIGLLFFAVRTDAGSRRLLAKATTRRLPRRSGEPPAQHMGARRGGEDDEDARATKS